MKKILRYLPLLALAVILSCTTVEEGMDRAEVLQVSTNNMDINALGGDDTFTITSHCDWLTEVSYKGADTKWIELSSTKGSSGTKDVTIVFDENKSVDDRYATITVSNDRYNLSQSIEIHQKAGEPFILLDQREKKVTADGETIELTVNSNVDYTITSSESWVQASVDSGSKGETKISINVDNSPVVEPRSATITFSGKEYDVTTTFNITQQKFEPYVELSVEDINSIAMGATSSVSIDSNISWKASCDAAWVIISPSNGEKGLSDILIKVEENTKTTVRETVITISNTEYKIEKQIAVSQEAFGPVLSVSTESISATAAGATNNITIDGNISWNASCTADWVTITPKNGEKGSSNLKVEIAANTKTSDRETVIKISNSEYKVEKQITVSQAAFDPTLSVSSESISAPVAGTTKSITVDGNISWNASCTADWVTITPKNGENGSSNLKVEIAANTKTSDRETVIKISNSEYKVEKQITVSQAAFDPTLSVSSESISAPVAGTTKSITVDGNISWNASCTADWVTITPKNGTKGSSTLKVEVAANTKTTTREAVIKVSNSEYNIEKQITVSQAAFGPTLSVSADSISAPVAGITKSLIIDSNISWEASCTADWVTITPTNGAKGTSTLNVEIAANTKASVRETVIKILNSEYKVEKQIIVSQEAFDPILNVGMTSISASVSGTTKSITIDGNISWNASCTADWVTITPANGNKGTSTLKVEVTANTKTSIRESVIKILNSEYGIEKQITVSQEAFSLSLSVSTEPISAPVEGTSKSVTIESNISWNASCAADWVIITPTNGNKGISTLKVEVTANTKTSVRESVINIFNDEYKVEKQIAVSQAAFDPALSASDEPIFAPVDGISKSIIIEGNISWSASCAADWVIITPTNGNKGTSTLKVEVKANTKASIRETVINIFNSEYNIEKQITVSQEAFSPTLSVSTESISAPVDGTTKSVTVESNISWKASCDANWVIVTPTNGDKGKTTLEITIKANEALVDRTTTVKVTNDEYNQTVAININQQAFYILYTSSDGKVVTPNITNAFGATIVSNTYENGQGIILFDAPVTSIGDNAFYECKSLTSVTIPSSVTSIGEGVFSYCNSLTSIYISDLSAWCNIDFTGSALWQRKLYLNNTEVTDLMIPSDITKIKDFTFYGCSSLTSVKIPSNVASIGEWAFGHCYNLASVTIPDSVTSIGDLAFTSCYSLKSVIIPKSVTSIGEDTFSNCESLTSVTIPDGVTSIGSRAFASCGITSIIIPASVTSIRQSAFSYCSSLISVYCKSVTPPSGNRYMFSNNASGRKIYVPRNSESAYKSKTYWKDYSSDIVGYDF